MLLGPMPTGDNPPSDLQALILRMRHLKAEHAPILGQIQADRGMSPRVRSVLLEHLGQEEDELAAEIARLSPSKAVEFRSSVPAPAGRMAGGQLTVGSLRVERRDGRMRAARAPSPFSNPPAGAAGARGTIGSLRRR
jgi:hypothetical protein